MSYTRSILAPYIGETPPPKIGSELPDIMTINQSNIKGGKRKPRGKGISSGGKLPNSKGLHIAKNDSLFGNPENPWISFLQTYGNRGLTMPELREKYHNMQVSVGGRRHMKGKGLNEKKAVAMYHPNLFNPKYLGGSQLAIGEYNNYAGPRALGLGGSESLFTVSKQNPGYRTRQVNTHHEQGKLNQRNLAIDLGGL